MNIDLQLEEKRFVEEVSSAFEQMNMPRMAGRIVGRLMIADPPHQSTDELTEALMASRGSISTMTRFLIQFNLIERFSLPGVRRDYFRIKRDTWHHLMRQRVHQITTLRRLAEHGLSDLAYPRPLALASLVRLRPTRSWGVGRCPLRFENSLRNPPESRQPAPGSRVGIETVNRSGVPARIRKTFEPNQSVLRVDGYLTQH